MTNHSIEDSVLSNMKLTDFTKTHRPIDGRITSLASCDQHVFVAVANKGILVFDLDLKKPTETCTFRHQIGHPDTKVKSKDVSTGYGDNNTTCHDVQVDHNYLVYCREYQGRMSVCVHNVSQVLAGSLRPEHEIAVNSRPPMVVAGDLDALLIGCSAWTESWTSGSKTDSEGEGCDVRLIDLNTMKTCQQWKAADNTVTMLRLERTSKRHLLGVSDSRTGVSVYDISHTSADSYALYSRIQVEEIRDFRLMGHLIAVFHKFEPNVTFWDMTGGKTILLVNVQDRLRSVVDDLTTNGDDCECEQRLVDDEDDDVTAVSGFSSDDDDILVYGTRSGAIFGLSVKTRCRIFRIACPHDDSERVMSKIGSLCCVSPGVMIVSYERRGLTVLNFTHKPES